MKIFAKIVFTLIFFASTAVQAQNFRALPQLNSKMAPGENLADQFDRGPGTVYEKVGKLFERGKMPDLRDFDPAKVPISNSIIFNKPDFIQKTQMITIEKENRKYSDEYVLEVDGKPVTVEDARADFMKEIAESRASALTEGVVNQQLTFYRLGSEGACGYFVAIRKVDLDGGKKILVSETRVMDKQPLCNPNGYGQGDGDISHRGYLEL